MIDNAKKTNAKLDKDNLYVFHVLQITNNHEGQPTDNSETLLSPVLLWKKVKYFYNNRDILEKHAKFNMGNQMHFSNFVLPYYVKDQKVDASYKDFIVVYGDKAQEAFPFIDLSLLLSVSQLEKFGGKPFVIDADSVDEKAFLIAANKHMQKCNKLIKILHRLVPEKCLMVKPQQISNVQPEKFVTAKTKGVGFGNANYLQYSKKSLMIDFGGLNSDHQDFTSFEMNANQNYILLTHWHLDHYYNYANLVFNNDQPKHFIAPTQIYATAELNVMFYMMDMVNTVHLLPMGKKYAQKPLMIIDDSLFIYGANYADILFDESEYGTKMFIDLNSASAFVINPINDKIINLFSGDQKYQYMTPALESFSQCFPIASIDLIHATHHGLLATPINDGPEPVWLKLNGVELKGNTAITSNDDAAFAENKLHQQFLSENFQKTLTTGYDDIIATYEKSSNACTTIRIFHKDIK